jgi:hypothetical protein
MNNPAKQPFDVVSSTVVVWVDELARPLGLLAGKANEAPDCWDTCEETAQLFYGPSQG